MSRPRIVYICATFPVTSEQFVRREVDVLLQDDVDVELVSLWGGDAFYQGVPIRRFNKWSLFKLIWMLPYVFTVYAHVLLPSAVKIARVRPPSRINFIETMLGFGYAICNFHRYLKNPPMLYHGIWATAPTSAAMMLSHLTRVPFTMGAHAYDVFQDGGDWFLREKIEQACVIRSSTMNTLQRLRSLGAPLSKLHLVRRGLVPIPEFRVQRDAPREPIRLLSIGRLVEKKGFFFLLRICRELKQRKIPFELRIIGAGSLNQELRDYRTKLGLLSEVEFWGVLPYEEVKAQYAWADLFMFCGRVSRRGDRDGLPNVIGEAMAYGVGVFTTDVGGTVEAISYGESGYVLPYGDVEPWIERIRFWMHDQETPFHICRNARAWVESNFDGERNARQHLTYLLEGVS